MNETYPLGQCTRWVADHWTDQVGPYWGDGRQWLTSARASGFQTTVVPTIGSVLCLGAYSDGAGAAGHVAIVTAVDPIVVSESNWIYSMSPDSRTIYGLIDLFGFILPRSAMVSGDEQRAQIHEWYYDLLQREVENESAMMYHLSVWNAKGKEACLAEIYDGPEATRVMIAKRKLLGI